jgi:hypothetical protein
MTRKWRTIVPRAPRERSMDGKERPEAGLPVSFSGMERDERLERMCMRELAKLARYAPRLVGCRVVVARANHRHARGERYEVRIRATAPRILVAVTRTPTAHGAAEAVDLAVREAFDRARRRLQDALRKLRGDVKKKSKPRLGRKGAALRGT